MEKLLNLFRRIKSSSELNNLVRQRTRSTCCYMDGRLVLHASLFLRLINDASWNFGEEGTTLFVCLALFHSLVIKTG